MPKSTLIQITTGRVRDYWTCGDSPAASGSGYGQSSRSQFSAASTKKPQLLVSIVIHQQHGTRIEAESAARPWKKRFPSSLGGGHNSGCNISSHHSPHHNSHRQVRESSLWRVSTRLKNRSAKEKRKLTSSIGLWWRVCQRQVHCSGLWPRTSYVRSRTLVASSRPSQSLSCGPFTLPLISRQT